jgi:hypothetical protein
MATLVPSRSARRIGLLVRGGNSGVLTDADLRGCRWIEGEPKPLRRGMFCGRPALAGESWCYAPRHSVWGRAQAVKGGAALAASSVTSASRFGLGLQYRDATLICDRSRATASTLRVQRRAGRV